MTEETTAQKKTVLVVEDEADLREAIVTALGFEGYEALSAADGEQGLRTALARKPDLILLDIVMPKMDGIAVLKQLRTDAWGKEVKVIVMTVLDDLEKIAEVVEQGGSDYVVKTNVTLKDIVDRVKEKIG